MTTPDFSFIKGMAVDAKMTAEFTIYGLAGMEPTLILAPAAECNKAFTNATLKHARGLGRRLRGSAKMTAAMLREGRERDVELYSKHVVRGWRGVVDSRGEAVEFNEVNCRSLLGQIASAAPDLFDEIRGFAGDLANFRPDGDLGPEDAEAIVDQGN